MVIDSFEESGLTTYPYNPFNVPALSTTGQGAEITFGLIESLISQHIMDIKQLREVEKAITTNPQSLKHDKELAELRWDNLSAEEKGYCPKIILLTKQSSLNSSAIAKLLTTDWPVKVVVFDDYDLNASPINMTDFALQFGTATVVSSSISNPNHMGSSLNLAMKGSNPALIHLYAPNPIEFSSQQTLEMASLAVEAQLHPLTQFDANAQGGLCDRLVLQNSESFDGIKLAHWIFGQNQFKSLFTPIQDKNNYSSLESWIKRPSGNPPFVEFDQSMSFLVDITLARFIANKAKRHARLLEMAGIASPLSQKIKADFTDEMNTKLTNLEQSLKQEHEQSLQQFEHEQKELMAHELTEKLLQLSYMAKDSDLSEFAAEMDGHT